MPPRPPQRRSEGLPSTQGEPTPQSALWAAWENAAHALLVNEMRRQRVTYKELSLRLAALGIQETDNRLNRRVTRKVFSAAFLMACLAALGVDVTTLVREAGQRDARQKEERPGAVE